MITTELKIAGKVYRKNFFRLTLPFLIPFGLSVYFRAFGNTLPFIPQILVWTGISLICLILLSGTVIDTWGAIKRKQFSLRKNWLQVSSRIPQLLLATILALAPWLTLFYLFLEFFNFFLVVALVIYPFFFPFLLPSLLISGSDVMGGLRNSITTSWNYSTKAAVVTYVPGMLGGILSIMGLASLIYLFLLPAWMVLTTATYYKVSECSDKSVKPLSLDEESK